MFWQDSERIVLERWPDGEGEEMKFRLVLRGRLPSDKRGVLNVKQQIRRELHPQLRELYLNHPSLGSMREMLGGQKVVDRIADNYARCGFRFVPIVREHNAMAVSLDFLILRRDEPHRVFSGSGDLDGRVKTLIDGLRMPQNLDEVVNGPSEDENPFFVLLEDDRLIYDFAVTTDRLLVPPEADEPHRDVVAIIGVHIKNQTGDDFAVLSHGFGVGRY